MINRRFKKNLANSTKPSHLPTDPDTFVAFPFSNSISGPGPTDIIVPPLTVRKRASSETSNYSVASETTFSPTQKTPSSRASSIYYDDCQNDDQNEYGYEKKFSISSQQEYSPVGSSSSCSSSSSSSPNSSSTPYSSSSSPGNSYSLPGHGFYKSSSSSTPSLPLVIPPKSGLRLVRSISTSGVSSSKVTYRHSRVTSKQFAFLKDFSKDLDLDLDSDLDSNPNSNNREANNNTSETILEEDHYYYQNHNNKNNPLNLSPVTKLNIEKKFNPMDSIVKEFEQELAVLDGFGEFDEDPSINSLSSNGSSTKPSADKALQPSAIPYSGSNSSLSASASKEPRSPSSSVYKSGTSASQSSPSASSEQQSPLNPKRKPSLMMGKIKTFGKRVISGDNSTASVSMAPSSSTMTKNRTVSSNLSTPKNAVIRSPGSVTPPDSSCSSQLKTPVISMRFSSEKK